MATNEGQVPVAGGEKPRRRRKTMMPRRLSPTDEEQQWLGLSVKRPRTKVYVDAAVSVPATTTSKTSCNRQTKGPSMNIRDFHRAFLDTEVVMHWCMGRELLASCRTCLKCGEDMRLTPCPLRVTSDGFQWSCYRQSRGVRCRVKRSIRAGSWFSNSKLSLIEILELTYWWSHKLPESFVMREMRLGSSHTVVDWYNFCREVCEVYLLDHSQPVGGKQVEVEIFESKFGRWKHHQGHQAEGQWVFGGVEKGSTWKCFLVPVQKSDADSLVPLIEKWILPGSIVISDWCGSRDRLGEEGHERLTGKHGLVFKDCQTSSTCMTTIEDSWRHAKAGFPDYSRCGDYFHSYLAECLWRKTVGVERDVFLLFLSAVAYVYQVASDVDSCSPSHQSVPCLDQSSSSSSSGTGSPSSQRGESPIPLSDGPVLCLNEVNI